MYSSLLSAFVCLASMLAPLSRAAPATQPASQPTIDISPAAQTLLAGVRDAYANAQSLDLAGTYTLDTDAAGSASKKSADFTAAFAAPSKLRHEMKDDVTVIGTGDAFVVHLVPRNGYINLPGIKSRGEALPEHVATLLNEQDPSLQLALAADASSALIEGATKVSVENSDTLLFERADRDVRVAVDPATHLLRKVSIDLRKMMTTAGVPDVKRAVATIEYSRTTVGEPIDAARFTWSAPPGATQLKADAPELAGAAPEDLTVGDDDGLSAPAMKLIGQPAPAFTLADLDGKKVSLADLKGKVVVLDFWATWCPPCRASLPHLAELSAKVIEAHDNVRVYAVNLREEPEKVAEYVKAQSLSLAVLLDTTGGVSKKYSVTGIPQTVVIGPDGAIRNVFIGYGPGGETKLAEAVRVAGGGAPEPAKAAENAKSPATAPASTQPSWR